jgi:hypothetical protein
MSSPKTEEMEAGAAQRSVLDDISVVAETLARSGVGVA